MPYDCFISYASQDLAFAEELHRRLVEAGLSVWFDKARLRPGCNWHAEIGQGCEASGERSGWHTKDLDMTTREAV